MGKLTHLTVGAIAASLAGTIFFAANAWGAFTYDVVDYPADEQGCTIGGTITVSNTGYVPGFGVTSWNITASGPGGAMVDFTPSNSEIIQGGNGVPAVYATPTTLEFYPPSNPQPGQFVVSGTGGSVTGFSISYDDYYDIADIGFSGYIGSSANWSAGTANMNGPGEIGWQPMIIGTIPAAISSGTWVSPASGSWTVGSHWSSNPLVPSGGTATLGSPNGPITVTLDGDQSVTALVFNSNNGSGYTLSQGNGGALTLGASTGGLIMVNHSSHTISAPIYMAGNLTVAVSSGATLQLSGPLSETSAGTSFTFNGPGTLNYSAAGAFSGDTNVNGGTLQITGGLLPAANEYVGDAAATVILSGGTNLVSSALNLGYNTSISGTYKLSGSGVVNAASEYVGYYGIGSFTQSGGTNNLGTAELYLAYEPGSSGSYNLSGNGRLSAGTEAVGFFGNGSFTQSGGTNSASLLAVGFVGSGSYTLSGNGQLKTTNEYVSYSSSGSFTQSGGNNAVSSGLYIGQGGGSNGSYNLSGGSLYAATTYVGYSSTGAFTQSGGNYSVPSLYVGYNQFVTATYSLSGTGQLSATIENVGYNGTGTFNQLGGNNATTGLYLGGVNTTTSSGTYTLTNGDLSAAVEDIGLAASAAGGTCSFTQSGGVNSVSTVLYIADNSAVHGLYTLSNGLLAAPIEYVGVSGYGVFMQSGGNNTVTSNYLMVADTGFSSGTYGLSGNGALSTPAEYIGYQGSGSFSQSGGTNAVSGALTLAYSTGSTGTYNLNGGLLSLGGLSQGNGAGSFNFSGGTIESTASFPTSVPIKLGGVGSSAVFNTNGNTLTLNGALTGAGGLQKTGPGTLVLAASNGYGGPTVLTAGVLEAANGNSGSATGSGMVTLNGGFLAAGAAGGTILGPVVAGSGPHTIEPGALLFGSYGTLNLNGGLTTNLYTTLLFSVSSALGMNGGNGQPIYYGDLINLNFSSLIVGASSDITFKVNPTLTGDYRLFADFNNSPNLNNFLLPSQNGVVYALSTTVDPGHIDLLVAAGNAGASGGTWVSPSSGNWTAAADWSCNPLIPTSGTVYFPGAPLAPITAALNGNQSAGALVFNVSNANGYTLSQGSGGALTLGDSSGATITVSSGPQVISAPLRLGGNLAVNVAAGASLQLSGVVSQGASGLGLTLNGPGLLTFGGTGNYSGDTTVNSGTLQINAGAQLPAANEYVGANAAAAYVVQNGGNNTITAGGALQGLIVGYGSGNAYYALNGGLLNSANELISYSGYSVFTQTGGTNQAGFLSVGTYYNGNYYLSGGLVSANVEYINSSALNGEFTQSGGTNQIATNLTVGFLGGGSYTMSAGLLSADNAYVGYGRGGNVFQSGGNFSLSTALYLAYQNGTQGSYYLSNSGLLTAPNEYVGYGGNGTFNQSGGTNSVRAGNLYLGYYPGGSGTYNLSGGVLDPVTEYVGNGGVGIFYQTGGTNTAANVSVNGGYFLLSGGQLQGSGGGTIGVVNGGFQSPGTLDLSQFVTVSAGTGALLDLSGNVLNTVGASVSVGPDSLLIVPQGFDPITSYASYSNQGLIHTLGSTLSVSASTGFGGWGTIADPVNCQGTILATPGGWINLNNGLSLADPGQVNLGTGTVIVNDTNFSSMTGGALTASLMVVGSNGTGSFPQSGGASALSSLYLGNNGGDSGTYLLSGTSQLSVGYEIVGLAGSGTFTQSGGTHAVGTLYLAEQFGSAGTYNLGGGLLSLSALYPYSGGAAAFNFGGGTLQAAAPLTIYMPITLSAAWTNGVFDTNGNASTLYGPLSGPGGLIVAGSGMLTLAVSNNYTGTTLVCNGTLMLGDSNALSGSTFDTSGTGALVFNGGIGGFAFGGLQGSGSLLLTDNGITDIALTVGLNNADTTFSGSLSDSNSGGSLTLVGTGTLTLTGTNTYGGGTVVEGGTLVLTNNEALPDGSNVAIGDPALLTMFGDVVSSARSTGFSRNASDDPAEAGTTSAVPEPSAAALLAAGGLAFLALRALRRRRP